MQVSRIFFSISFISFLMLAFLVFLRTTPQRLQFKSLPDALDVLEIQPESTPTGIVISSLNLWLPILPARVLNGRLETTYKGVSYMSLSAIPGSTGNAILYGHNWPNLLGNLSRIEAGDNIEIIFADNTKATFIVTTIQEVSPDTVSVLEQTNDKRITLYTCSGFLDTKRLVVTALMAS